MRLVAHHLQQLQRRIVPIEPDRIVGVGHVDLFLAFRQTGDRDSFDAQPIERRERRVELSPSAVDQDHVRQGPAFVEQPSITPIDRLGHRAKIVRAGDAADVEHPVLVFVELPAIEYHHPGDGVAALNVGDVERFDAIHLAGVPKKLCKSGGSDLQPILL